MSAEKIIHLGCDLIRSFSNPNEYGFLLVWESFIGSGRMKIEEMIGDFDQDDANVLAEIIRWLATGGSTLLDEERIIQKDNPAYTRSDVYDKLLFKFYDCRKRGYLHGMTMLEFILGQMDPEFRRNFEEFNDLNFKPTPATLRQLEVATALFRWLGTKDGEIYLQVSREMAEEQRKLQSQLYRISVHKDKVGLREAM